MKYRHKPTEVEAVQYTGENEQEIRDFAGKQAVKFAPIGAVTGALEEGIVVCPGDYVTRLMRTGYFYACPAEIFEKNYEKE